MSKKVPKEVESKASEATQKDSFSADRYYAIAEVMNQRGALELAVPFYRQAFALLVAERNVLKKMLGDEPQDPTQIEQHKSNQFKSTSPNDKTQKHLNVNPKIKQLSEQLNPSNAKEVLKQLKVIESNTTKQTALGLMLKGKAEMMLARKSIALKSFEKALSMAPNDADILINTGAALITNGKPQASLEILRKAYRNSYEELEPHKKKALLRNFSLAESMVGSSAAALRLRRQWLQLSPHSIPVDRCLSWANVGLKQPQNHPERNEAIALLKELSQVTSNQKVLRSLAQALEEQLDYKEASQVHRKLLNSHSKQSS